MKNGDLVQTGSQLDLVFGVDKLRQDVKLWMTERYGGDRFHPDMGSILQDFVGGVADESILSELHAEVLRVLQSYQELLALKFRNSPQSLSASELLVSVDDIAATIFYDTVNVAIRIRNGSQDHTTIKIVTGNA